MSEWDFLWDLEGQELIDAMTSGGTYDDWAYIERMERKQYGFDADDYFITNSAMGERQMLPWQTNNTRIIYFLLLTYLGLSRFFLIFRAFAHFFSLSTIFPFLGFFRHISVCFFHQMV